MYIKVYLSFFQIPAPFEVNRFLYLANDKWKTTDTLFPAPFEVNRFHYDRRDFG